MTGRYLFGVTEMTDEMIFVNKLKRLHVRQTVSRTPTAILGSVADLTSNLESKPWFRIGMWPCASAQESLVAMGVWCVFASLLERWAEITIYRLFVQFPDETNWDDPDFSFTPDDWGFESLDENVAIWGSLERLANGAYHLTVTVENDYAVTGDEVKTFELQAPDLTGLLRMLPDLSGEVAGWIGAVLYDASSLIYVMDASATHAQIERDLKRFAQWNLHLLRYLWDESWQDDQILSEFATAQETMHSSHFSAWITAKMVTQVLLPGVSAIADLLQEEIVTAAETGKYRSVFAATVAPFLYRVGYVQQSYEMLESVLITEQNAECALILAKLTIQGGRLDIGISTLQNTILDNTSNSLIYREYGTALMLAAQYNFSLNHGCFVNPNDFSDVEFAVNESVESFQKAVELDPADIESLFMQILQMASLEEPDEERIANAFRKLVKIDKQGEYLRDVIDVFYDLDVDSAIETIENEIRRAGKQRHLLIACGMLHLMVNDSDAAISFLENARELSSTPDQLADVEQLLLAASDPDFEQNYAELVAKIDAGNTPSADEVDFLDSVVQQAPHLVQGILALAKAYSLWEDLESAMEVLLDANERLPLQPEIIDLLARVLWELDQHELAFQYLNQALEKSPNHVGLIVRTGQYLFDSANIGEAKIYLARAEDLDPQNPRLAFVRTYIARRIAENPDLLG
jgi:tetratricopeptide (TPR) repeat protein